MGELPRPGLSGKWQPGAGQKPAGSRRVGRVGGGTREGRGDPKMVAGACGAETSIVGGPRPHQWVPSHQSGRPVSWL